LLRPTQPADTQSILALAAETAVFRPSELVALEEVLCDFFGTNKGLGHKCVTAEDAGQVQGFVYYAPASMTDRGWYLYWIAVNTRLHTRGIGTAMLTYCEEEIRRQRGRMLLIETSSLPHYEPARKFYAKHGYAQLATLTDFYADGDHMVVFNKRLT
jgi:ribosomal protein S18 acetylase RimI-like enzyme